MLYCQSLIRFVIVNTFISCILLTFYLHISGSLTMIRAFDLIRFPESIGILNNFLESLCHFSICFPKLTVKAYLAS